MLFKVVEIVTLFAIAMNGGSGATKSDNVIQSPIKSLKDFGYYFNEAGELRDISTDSGFVFDVYGGDKEKNQRHYEELGVVVEKHVYKLLEEEVDLTKVFIPLNGNTQNGRGFIFNSKDAMSNEKLVMIIHGSGVVRAGQWSRRLIINHSLQSGTQLPYIKKAKELGYAVIVTNSNQNYDDVNGKVIKGSESPQGHFNYVWQHFVQQSSAKHIAIVAHSYGGVITLDGVSENKDLTDKVFSVALTDSVHGHQRKKPSEGHLNWLKKNVLNWVSSGRALNTPLRSHDYDCPTVSAGTPIHEETSWKAFDSVWEFIQSCYQERIKENLSSEFPAEGDIEMNSQLKHTSDMKLNVVDNEQDITATKLGVGTTDTEQ